MVICTFVILTRMPSHLLNFLIVSMSENVDILWKKVLSEIQTEVSSANFLTLFKNTYLVTMEGGVATIAAPSSMIIDLLNKRFYQIIKEALDRNTNGNNKLIFVPKSNGHPSNFSGESPGPLFALSKERRPIGHIPRVRPDFNFQNFAVSSTNQLAYVSTLAVSKKIGAAYNPLFIYGPVGVGKTHLMQAVANEIYRKSPDKKILYITSEEFTNEVVEAIRGNETAKMKRRFRDLDLLMIDDVQFIGGKERVQEELFHTFNILVDRSSQIILTSDRPPQELKKTEKRLISRFSGGLTVDIEPPDFELRCAILLTKAKKYNFDLSIEIAKIIAEKTEDTRELEGMLLRVMTQATDSEDGATPALAKRALLGNGHRAKTFYPEEVIKSVCSFYGIKSTQLKGEKRDARLVRARHVCMFILKKQGGLTFTEIGNILGGRDHTTVMHGVEKIERLISEKVFSEDSLGISSFFQDTVDK